MDLGVTGDGQPLRTFDALLPENIDVFRTLTKDVVVIGGSGEHDIAGLRRIRCPQNRWHLPPGQALQGPPGNAVSPGDQNGIRPKLQGQPVQPPADSFHANLLEQIHFPTQPTGKEVIPVVECYHLMAQRPYRTFNVFSDRDEMRVVVAADKYLHLSKNLFDLLSQWVQAERWTAFKIRDLRRR
jgi:hypothetical protein